MSSNFTPGRGRYSLRSACSRGSCNCSNTPDLPRSALRCRNSRDISKNHKNLDTPRTDSIDMKSVHDSFSNTNGSISNTFMFHSNGSTSASISSIFNGSISISTPVSSLKNGSPGRILKQYRVHWPLDAKVTAKDSNGWETVSTSPNDRASVAINNGNAIETDVEMSTTSRTSSTNQKVYGKFTSQKFKFGSVDGSHVSSDKSYNEDRFAHPGYRTQAQYYTSEVYETGSGKGFASEKYNQYVGHKDGNGSVVVTDEDNFLHRKSKQSNRNQYDSSFETKNREQTIITRVLYSPINFLTQVAGYVYTLVVHLLVIEKWLLRTSRRSACVQGDSYYYNNLYGGYASNGTNEGYSSKLRHFFFKDKKLVANHIDTSESRRNVVVYNNTNSSKSFNNSFNSLSDEEHLSDDEHFTSSRNHNRELCVGCLKIFSALLFLAMLGFLVYLLWPPISSSASASTEFVGSCLRCLMSQTVGVLYYLGSLSFMGSGKTTDSNVLIPKVPVTEENINVQTAAINPIPLVPVSPIISKEELEDILSRLKTLETKVSVHDNKFVLYDTNNNELKDRLTQLELAMQEASAKGKTPDQILHEIINFNLGETSDGKTVTLLNLATLWNAKNQDENKISTLEVKLKTLAAKIVSDADLSQSDRNKIKMDVLGLQNNYEDLQVKVKVIDKPVEVDLNKLKESILPILLSEVESQVKISCETRDCPAPVPSGGGGFVGGSEKDLEKLIKMAIAKYDADKTGLPDLALESAGGTILSTRCTKSSKLRNSVVSFFGFKVWSPPNNPRTIIQPGVVPGECWAFEGSVGDIVIQLVAPSIITGFTMEHISKDISPYGNIDSAPYKFEVWGLNAENDFDTMWNYGTFSYEDNGESLQYFAVPNATAHAYPIVEVKILSNHGNLRHTCLYRFRVHGALDMKVIT